MPNNPEWENYDHDLRELYAVAADLVAGHGGPEEYRARQSDPRLLMPAFGKTQLIVGVWEEPYGPLTAICVAGFILFGTAFEQRFGRMGLTGRSRRGVRAPRAPLWAACALSRGVQVDAIARAGPRDAGSRRRLPEAHAEETGTAAPAAAPASRPALAAAPSHPALPDLGGRS